MKNLVLIGGGHSHSIALRLWGLDPLPEVKLILVTDTLFAPYSGMLPGHLGGLYSFAECHIDLQALAQFAQAELILDAAIGLDLQQNQVLCHNRAPVDFDWLSIDIGSTPAIDNSPGVMEYAISAKPVPQFLLAWQQFLQQVDQYPLTQPISLGIVGGGAGGVELALTLQARLKSLRGMASLSVHLFHRQPELMNSYQSAVRRRFRQLLIDRGIHLHLNESVIAIQPQESVLLGSKIDMKEIPCRVGCRSGLNISCDRVIWVTQAAAPAWLADSGLATDAQGFVSINQYLQSTSHPHIFATGDIATMEQAPRPKAGVFAVRQGQPLLINLHRTIAQQKLQAYQPQNRYLSLIGLGNQQAIATWGNICTRPSRLLWRWKNQIDRRFMAQFRC
jgi:selenide, water dikinase